MISYIRGMKSRKGGNDMETKKLAETIDDASMTIGGCIELINDLLRMYVEYHSNVRALLKGYHQYDPTDGFVMLVEQQLDRIDKQTERLNNLDLSIISDTEKAS